MTAINTFPTPSHPHPKRDDPVWDLALMYPLQGSWTVENYLRLDTGLLVEYTDGFIRVLPMPNLLYQWITKFLFRLLDDFVNERILGEVLLAPLPVPLTPRKFREPDIVFLKPQRIKKWKGQPAGADLVVEVVSEGKENWERDYVEKRKDYAEAGFAEYWIVDPQERKITVLTLADKVYFEHGVYTPGETASSVLLSGFTCNVGDLFAKCDEADDE